jgi:hypothetical protein
VTHNELKSEVTTAHNTIKDWKVFCDHLVNERNEIARRLIEEESHFIRAHNILVPEAERNGSLARGLSYSKIGMKLLQVLECWLYRRS